MHTPCLHMASVSDVSQLSDVSVYGIYEKCLMCLSTASVSEVSIPLRAGVSAASPLCVCVHMQLSSRRAAAADDGC